jgi:hypothetical protein
LITKRELHTLSRVLKVIDKVPKWIGDPPPAGGHDEEKGSRGAEDIAADPAGLNLENAIE